MPPPDRQWHLMQELAGDSLQSICRTAMKNPDAGPFYFKTMCTLCAPALIGCLVAPLGPD